MKEQSTRHRHHHHHRSHSREPHQESFKNTQGIQAGIFTILSNLAAVLVYGIFLNVFIEAALALIMFSIVAVLHIILCAVVGFHFNNKIWLASAIMIFLIASGAVVYATI